MRFLGLAPPVWKRGLDGVFGIGGQSGGVFASLLSGASYPTSPQAAPANLVPQPAGEFSSATGWTAHTGQTITEGVARWDGTQATTQNPAIAMVAPMAVGRQYGFLSALRAFTSGSIFLGAGTPGVQNVTGAGLTETRHYSRSMTATGAYNNARYQIAAGTVLDVDYLRAYDLTALLEKKWRIVFVYSQSNWVGTEAAADRLANDPPEPRALVVPSLANNLRGTSLDGNGVGVPLLLVDPVVHMTISDGGPAGAFARTFCDGLRDDEVLVYIATGYSGGGRMAADGVWNRETNGVAWANMLKQVDGTLAKAPAGSTVAGMLFCQGEADLAINTGDTHTALIKSDIEFLRARYGAFPVVVNEIGWADTGRADVANMTASQAKLDSDSGHVLSLPRCRYLPRPAGATFLPDTLHYDQVTQRLRGAAAAQALLGQHYGALV